MLSSILFLTSRLVTRQEPHRKLDNKKQIRHCYGQRDMALLLLPFFGSRRRAEIAIETLTALGADRSTDGLTKTN